MFEIKQSIFGIQVAFFKEIRHYFSIFFGFLREFLVALNSSFTSTIEKGLIPDYIARGNCYEVFEIIEHFQLENSALDDIVRRVSFSYLQT